MTPPRRCSTCIHWVRWSYPNRTPLGVEVGSCTCGGPTPGEGSSDVGANESCERHEPKEAT